MTRVKYKDLYNGRYVQFHYPNDNRILKVVELEYISGFHVAEELSSGRWEVRYRIASHLYELPTNHGLWETETTLALNREYRLNKLLTNNYNQ